MIYKFHAYGHPNILAMHKTTSEFTKDSKLSLKGNCIVGVNADFELGKIKDFIKNTENKKITITLRPIYRNNKKIQERITAEINPNFDSDKELVIRKTDFVSERTFAIKADKAAFQLNEDLIGFLQEKKNRINIIIENR